MSVPFLPVVDAYTNEIIKLCFHTAAACRATNILSLENDRPPLSSVLLGTDAWQCIVCCRELEAAANVLVEQQVS